ncbi:MAG: cell cycle protein [Planctomycetaceae bacterium]|nr:cell cycle protein [Planctomycetaceae bacterium]
MALLAAGMLTVIGIVAIDASDLKPGDVRETAEAREAADATGGAMGFLSSAAAKKQAVFFVVALVAMLITAVPHFRLIGPTACPLMGLTLLALVLVVLPFMPREFVPVRGGARRWFNFQVITVQPSEVAKIVFLLALAWYLRFRANYRTLRGLLVPLLITFVPMGLIVIEPDLGTSLIFLPVLFAMLVAAGAKLKHLIAIVLIGLSLTPGLYFLLRPHQQSRINAALLQWQDDESERHGAGYQGYMAQMLVGAGGTTGNPPSHARNLLHYNHLPERHNDMIFAVICTRWGLMGGVAVLGMYVLLVTVGVVSAAQTQDPFARLIAVGVVAVIFTQVFVNVGMTVGLLPITGLTLPFISYGGSSLVVNFLMVGLLINVAARRPIVMARPAFEFGRR